MTADRTPALVVAVPTFRRPDRLVTLLARLREQADAHPNPVRIAVVDNDPAHSAAAVAADAAVEYHPEPRPGIGAVRSRALSLGDPDGLVVMLDDDLVPEPGWLDALVQTWTAHRPAVVMGYVHYRWPEGTDPWLVAGGFLRRDRVATGTVLQALATGSVAVDVAQVRALGIDFDAARGLAGGEDTQFGQELVRRGGTIIACAESVACEDIPVERATRAFVRTRTIGHGEGRVHLEGAGRRGLAALVYRIRALAGGVVRLVVFETLHQWGRLRGDLTADAVGRRRAWFAWGRIRGAWGLRTHEYARGAS